MAKAKKLPSGNYRVQVFAGYKKDDKGNYLLNAKGKKIPEYVSFTHPDKDEAEYLAAEFKRERKTNSTPSDLTVRQAIEKYIESRTNVLSPTTIQGYKKIAKHNLQSIMDIKVKKLTQEDIQAAVNIDAMTHKPKTVKNAHALLSAVLKKYRPNMRLDTSLPEDKKTYKVLPPAQVLIDAVYGTDIELAALLAMWLSFSMSEIKGLKKSDIKDGVLTLNRVMVDGPNGGTIVKEQMKEYERARRHVVPPYIMELIEKCDTEYLVPLSRHQIGSRWTALLKKNNIPHITFHDLRHVNASVMHLLRIPDKYAMERGGWKTDRTMKKVYQNVFSDERLAVDRKVNRYFDKLLSNTKKKISHEISHV
ncbi:MAG: hypothetical protein GXW96_12385 [Christensenellaceae bacterium]|nr:hypothetical protein [Christensenellaceae bacterium]